MQKFPLRPLRLVRLTEGLAKYIPMGKQDNQTAQPEPGPNEASHTRASQSELAFDGVVSTPPPQAPLPPEGDAEANRLLKSTPYNYLFGQAYGLWLYISLFLLTIVIVNGSTERTYGIYAAIQTAINTLLYIVAFGLEDAAVTFVPRLFAERGRGAAAHFIRRLLFLRGIVLLLITLLLLFGLPGLIALIQPLPYVGKGIADNLAILKDHTAPITLYAVTTSIANLLNAVCAARMHMHRVLVIGGVGQFLLLSLGFFALANGWGLHGVLWMQAIASTLMALGFLGWMLALLLTQKGDYEQPLKPVLELGFSAWQTNLVSGALFKQVSIILISIFVANTDTAFAQIGLFNIAFQLADAANVLLVAGFAGVGASALAAAFIGNNYDRLGRSWEVLIKVETLLAAPGLVFCLFNAQNIIDTLYDPKYAAAGSLLAIFLFFNLIYRVAGSTVHQASLYIIGKPKYVVISQWVGLGVVIVLGTILIPSMGAAGALVADGIAKAGTGVMMLVFLVRYLPRGYALDLLGFTLRFLVALAIAAIPSLLWRPSDRLLLVLSGFLFVGLCVVLLAVIKPLSKADMETIGSMKPKLKQYLRWFARG